MANAVLVGNSNVGKTTLFNSLTGQDEHTGNWAGVTVGVKSADVAEGYTVTDLPGIYSFNCFSMEEEIAKDYLAKHKGDKVFNIAECKNISRNLFLTLQMIEMGITPILLINMTGAVYKNGGKFNCGKLAEQLGLQVYEIDARNGTQCKKLISKCLGKTLSKPKQLPYLSKLPLYDIARIAGIAKNDIPALINLFCKDGDTIKKLNLPETVVSDLERLLSDYGDTAQYMAKLRYDYIDGFINEVLVYKDSVNKKQKLFFNKYFSLAIFALLLGGVFWLVFAQNGLGGFLVSKIDGALSLLKDTLSPALTDGGVPLWLVSFVIDVIVEGIGVVAKFLPQVLLLFFFLNMLEDTGYISRVAFMFDGLLSKVGLNGKSIFTLLLSLGCNTTAVATSNNLGNKEIQKRTLLLSPFFPCSAKMPVYLTILMLAAPLLKGFEIFVLIALYAACILTAASLAGVLQLFGKTEVKNDFVLEISEMRLPSLKRVASSVWKNAKTFVARLVGILFLCVALTWVLKSFGVGFEFLPQDRIEESILAQIGKGLAFLFKPIGIFDWRICVALILGITAKEVVAGTLILLFGSSFAGAFDWQTVVVIMLFVALYVPCIATVAMIKKECGTKTALLSVGINLTTAYSVCFVFYSFTLAFEKSVALGCTLIGVILFIAFTIAFVLKYFGRCKNCKGCASGKIKLHD